MPKSYDIVPWLLFLPKQIPTAHPTEPDTPHSTVFDSYTIDLGK
jgi:hypothetical protein